MKDPDDIFERYDPSNPVHNPAGYMHAKYEVDMLINRKANEIKRNRIKDKPGQFAKLGYVYWLVIVAMCMFVGWLFAK